MSQWIERINSHAVWGELNTLGAAIDRALEQKGNDADIIDGLERIRTVLALCGKRLAATDPVLMEPRSLSTLGNLLTAVRAEVEAYVTDELLTHIASANSKADEILSVLPTILAPITTDDLTVINESISSYRTTLKKYLHEALVSQQEVKEASKSNANRITALEADLNAEQKKLANLVLENQSQFSTAQDKRASEFSAALADQLTKFATSAAEQQTLFSKDQDARKSDFSELQRVNQEKLSGLVTEYTQKLNDQDKDFSGKLEIAAKAHEANLELLKSNYETSAQRILDRINIHREEVEKLVGVIGNLGVTSGYQKVANLARKMLFLWQSLTVIALGGLIYVAFQMAFPSPMKSVPISINMTTNTTSLTAPTAASQSSEKSATSTTPESTSQSASAVVSDSTFYQGLATRIFLSLTFGIFAGYAARQASHFLDMERKNRKLALELEALGPYIAPLDKDKQDEFRLKIGDRSFGVHDEILNTPKSNDPVTPYDVVNLKELGEFAASLVKGIK